MLNKRHLTRPEIEQIIKILESAGVVEMLRLLGTWIAHNHYGFARGDRLRSRIFDVARELDGPQERIIPTS